MRSWPDCSYPMGHISFLVSGFVSLSISFAIPSMPYNHGLSAAAATSSMLFASFICSIEVRFELGA